MRQLGAEEKAALLLPTADDDNNDYDENHELINSPSKVNNDNFPVVTKLPKTYQRRRTSSTHPVLCFTLVMGAFILGCVSGVVIILYRMSQDAEKGQSSLPSNSVQTAATVDVSIRTKLFQSITTTNFINVNRTIESQNDAANKLLEQWQSFSPILTPNGIKLLDKSEEELLKIDRLSTDGFLSFASLVKSGTVNGNSIYYVNYGRQEDFAYLFKNRIDLENSEKSIVFMRRKQTIISQTEQIHQAIHYGFGALVLFDDDESQQIATTNERHSFFREWARYRGIQERQSFVDGVASDKDHSIPLLILSKDQVERLFASLQPDSNKWLPCPAQWIDKPTKMKIGGELSSFTIRLVVSTQEVKIQSPIVMSSIRGGLNPEHFVMIGYQLGSIQHNKIINEIIKAYTTQIKNGWKPRKSILFCAWSSLDYDHYTIRRWISDNYRLVERNLIAYLDLGNGILANSTLNLHGSPLLEQIAHHAADAVPSPLKHDHTCHHRQKSATTVSPGENHHDHGRKRRDGGHDHNMETNAPEEVECEPHKLLDEWLRASNNRIGLNKSLGMVQSIDIDSSAALFQLQYGIPALLIEMTEEQAVTNDTFYVRHSPPVFGLEIQPEVYVAYTQFVSEIIRQLIDEPLIAFNLTNYADQIDKQVTEFLARYEKEYLSLSSHLGSSNEFKTVMNDLTKSIRQSQSRIDEIPKNDYIRLHSLNNQLINFERLFIGNDQLRGMNTADKVYKHILMGPAFGLTNTAVPFPVLSNILYGIPEDPSTELCDASKLFWSKLKEHIRFIRRTLNGFDGILINEK